MKSTKPFSFAYPLKHKVVRDMKIITETVGELTVEGVGYFYPSAPVHDPFDRYAADIDFIRWNGCDIKQVLEVTGGLDLIEEAAVRYVASLFENKVDIVHITPSGLLSTITKSA
jgi:hypothetical protein